MPTVLGSIVGVVFFLLVLFAAITSAIALIEVNVAVITEKFKIPRKWSAIIIVVAATALGIVVSLSQGGYIGGIDILSVFDTFANTFLLPLAGILTCIFVGYIWKPKNALSEITAHMENGTFKLGKLWSLNIRTLCPALIAVLFVYGIVDLFI